MTKPSDLNLNGAPLAALGGANVLATAFLVTTAQAASAVEDLRFLSVSLYIPLSLASFVTAVSAVMQLSAAVSRFGGRRRHGDADASLAARV